MALSNELITQFAKLSNQKIEEKDNLINGTVKVINSKEYVRLDGSDILTPVTSTVDIAEDERVSVRIKDHAATIISNITSPAARSRDVQTLKDEVDQNGNTIKMMDNTITQQGNSIIQMENNINQQQNTINQHNNRINQQNDTIISLNNTIISQGNEIEANNNAIEANGNQIELLNDTVRTHGNNIVLLENTVEAQGNRIQANSNQIIANGNRITAQQNTIDAQGNTIISQGNTIEAQNTQLTTHNSQITILNSGFVIQNGVLTGLSEAVVNKLKTDTLDVGYANIDFSNINIAAIERLFANSGIIENLVIEEGAITGELVGITIKGDLIEGNTIVADKLVLRGSDGLYYKLNTTGETIESEQTDQNSLNGQVIAANSITASKIQVSDLVAFDATIGGFDISDHSINTHGKDNVNSPFDGLYLGSDGQLAFGDDQRHIKYYKDNQNNYILDVRLDKLYLGSSTQTADKQFESLVEISANNLTTVFKTSGGSNLLRNSVGYSGTDFWLFSGNISTNQNDDMSLSGSEFILTGDASLEQIYSTQPGTLYSVAFKYKHRAVGTANNIKVEIVGNGNSKTILNTTDVSNDWVTVSLEEPYVATTNSPKIVITCTGDDVLEITDLIVSQGTNDVWSGYIDEIYGKKHQLDANGLRLYSESSNRSTNTTSTSYQLKDGNTVIGELSRDRVYTKFGEFSQGMQIGRLHTMLLDDDNIIEYV